MRLMVIGWDGATFRTLDPWLAAGYLPTLQKLLARGVRADLISTIPPVTAPAWVSCFSGVNPGRHGIYNFVRPAHLWPSPRAVAETPPTPPVGAAPAPTPPHERSLHSSRDVQVPRLWQYLNALGLTTHVVDVPLTFPPEPVDGFMVSDLMVAGDGQARTWPESLRETLKTSIGADFSWAIGDGLAVSEAYLSHLADSIQNKVRLDTWLIAQQSPDAFITVYQHTDVLAHYFWHVWDETHPAHDPALTRRLMPALRQVLAALDHALSQLLTLAGEEALVAMVSDHGFGPARLRVHPNDLLRTWGDLHLSRRELLKLSLATRGISPGGIIGLARRLDVLGVRHHLKLETARQAVKHLDSLAVLPDLSRTRAYFSHGLDPGICLSPEARGDEAYVEGLMARLRSARPSPDAPPFFERVLRREEVFHGAALARAPELVLQLSDGYVATPELLGGPGWSEARAGQVSGFHRPEGVLVLAGPGVLEGVQVAPVSILAVSPTLLAGLGLPVPEGLDAKPVHEAFEEGLITEESLGVSTHNVIFPAKNADKFLSELNPSANTVFDGEEQAAIRRRLEALGYH